MIEQLDEIEARAAKATPGPCEYGTRRDGSMWMSIGDPVRGAHIQADWEFGESNALAFAAARTDIHRLIAALRVTVEALTKMGLETIPDDASGCSEAYRVMDRIEAALKGDTHAG